MWPRTACDFGKSFIHRLQERRVQTIIVGLVKDPVCPSWLDAEEISYAFGKIKDQKKISAQTIASIVLTQSAAIFPAFFQYGDGSLESTAFIMIQALMSQIDRNSLGLTISCALLPAVHWLYWDRFSSTAKPFPKDNWN